VSYSGLGAGLRAPRSGIARGRPYAGGVLALEVIGLRQAERIPEGLQDAYAGMMRRLETQLVDGYRAVVPGRPLGRLGIQVQSRRLARGSIVVGTFGSKFAKALDRGFTSKPKNKRALRFNVGGTKKFAARVHVEGKHFHEKAIADASLIVEAVYMDFFFDPRELRFG